MCLPSFSGWETHAACIIDIQPSRGTVSLAKWMNNETEQCQTLIILTYVKTNKKYQLKTNHRGFSLAFKRVIFHLFFPVMFSVACFKKKATRPIHFQSRLFTSFVGVCVYQDWFFFAAIERPLMVKKRTAKQKKITCSNTERKVKA